MLRNRTLSYWSTNSTQVGSVLCASFESSIATHISGIRDVREVQVNEALNQVLEISTRSQRVARGDLDQYYQDSFEPEPIIECCLCKAEALDDEDAGQFRIFNLPDGSWQLLCPTCEPPASACWEFDRTVLVPDPWLSGEVLQRILLFLKPSECRSAALLSRRWSELSWTRLSLRDDEFLNLKLTHPKLAHVWVLHVHLTDPSTASSYGGLLCDAMHNILALSELVIAGVTDDDVIIHLAETLKNQLSLQTLDLGQCQFTKVGFMAIVEGLRQSVQPRVQVILPLCCTGAPNLQQGTKIANELAEGTQVHIHVV